MQQSQWFYQLNNQQFGPVSYGEIADLLSRGQLTYGSYVWSEGMTDWQQIGQIPELATTIQPVQIRQRPQSVTVLGTLNIVFGGLSLLCSPFGIIGLLMPQPDSPFQISAAMKLYSLISYAVGFVFAIILLASGIGLLKLKNWARRTAYFYGCVAIVWGVLGTVINFIMFMPSLGNVSEEAMPAVVGGIVGGMCGGILGLIYPVILVIFMRKPHVIAACKQ